ncbi:hypothetical protein AB0D49_34250 [Streptomyces sp. NPDC048290]|uniref:hypothetical protein n=1 Tax=Streptomyces sp. NPDC048290 TaxID=3155811 RepID=UPI003423A2D9
MVSLTKPGRSMPPPRMCGTETVMPVDLIAIMFVSVKDSAPDTVARSLRCCLQEHSGGRHHDLVWELDDPSDGEVWAQWADGCPPDTFRVVPDCNTPSGPTAADEVCTLFDGHPGCHTFEYTDPVQDALTSDPEFQREVRRLRKLIDRHIPRQPSSEGDGGEVEAR